MENKFHLIEEDMQKLSRMSQTLFSTWQDKMAEHFSEGCLNEMERQWKEYANVVQDYMRQLNRIEKEMNEYHQNCKRR